MSVPFLSSTSIHQGNTSLVFQGDRRGCGGRKGEPFLAIGFKCMHFNDSAELLPRLRIGASITVGFKISPPENQCGFVPNPPLVDAPILSRQFDSLPSRPLGSHRITPGASRLFNSTDGPDFSISSVRQHRRRTDGHKRLTSISSDGSQSVRQVLDMGCIPVTIRVQTSEFICESRRRLRSGTS